VSASNPAAPEPTRIGKFEIEKKLGAGAMGTVYKAKDPELGRMVAIKTIRLEGLAASQASLDDLVARFKREARVAASLRHPNIVTIHDIGSVPGNSYLVMEYVDGVGLDAVIKKGGKMSVERAAAIGAQVADALDYAWKQQKLVHRDIKPANIMVEPGDHVKVTDFGIAKLVSGETVDNLTATGSLLGTPSYMSPEQARGRELDGRSDLFSVGCVLYEMVCGQRAFRGESITALIFKIISEDPPPLREIDPTVSEAMVQIIGKALSKAPETRYQSGRELAADLLAITRPGHVPTLRSADVPTLPPDAAPGDVPTIQSPPTAQSPPTLASAPTLERPLAAPAPAVPPAPPTVLTAPTAAGTPPPLPAKAASAASRTPPRAPVAAPARRQGGGTGLIVGLGVGGLLLLALVVAGGWLLMRRGPATPPAPVADAAPASAAAPSSAPYTGSGSGPLPAEAVPAAPAGSAPPPLAPSAAAPPSRPATSPTGASAAAPARPPQAGQPPTASAAPAGGATQLPPTPAGPTADDFTHLDELPGEEPDGRATGEALAQKYRSGGGSSYSTSRFQKRPRIPRGITLPERPAAATLLYLHSVEEAYHRTNGRYGTLRELRDAQLLALDVPLEAKGFKRARYAFELVAQAGSYRAEALPQGPGGRALIVDDSGFVRFRDE
jgi:serine/threonine protein kinase